MRASRRQTVEDGIMGQGNPSETNLEAANASHALILVLGGDMRDVDDFTQQFPLPSGVKDTLGFRLLSLLQGMRPLKEQSISRECLSGGKDKANLEILAIVDRFDTPGRPTGIDVVRISHEGAEVLLSDNTTEDPAVYLPAALRACAEVPHTAVVFWGHGSGIFGGLLGDAHPGRGSGAWLPVEEAAARLAQGGLGKGKKIDMVGVVGCFSGMAETLGAFEPYTRTFVGFANKIDPRFFDFSALGEEMRKERCEAHSCTKGEHWARASIMAIERGYTEYTKPGNGEYFFAQCAASAWRTDVAIGALERATSATAGKKPMLQRIQESWPTILEKAVGEAHFYDDMDSVDLFQFVTRIRENSAGAKDLKLACEEFLKAMEPLRTFVKGYGASAEEILKGLGVWLPRRAGPPFRRVERSYGQLVDLMREDEKLSEERKRVRSEWLALQQNRFRLRRKPAGLPRHIWDQIEALEKLPASMLEQLVNLPEEKAAGPGVRVEKEESGYIAVSGDKKVHLRVRGDH